MKKLSMIAIFLSAVGAALAQNGTVNVQLKVSALPKGETQSSMPRWYKGYKLAVWSENSAGNRVTRVTTHASFNGMGMAILNLRPGHYLIKAMRSQRGGVRSQPEQNVNVTAGQTQSITLTVDTSKWK